MSFWDKVKEFVGVDEDYIDDEFYDDYDDLEEYKDDQYYETAQLAEDEVGFKDDAFVDENKDEVKKAEEKPYKPETKSYRSETKQYQESTLTRREDRTQRRNLSSGRDSKNSAMFVTIREPLTYEDGKIVLDDIMDGKSVVLNLEMLEVEKKTQIFYFVSGGLYSLNGTIQNVTKDIYVLAPHGVEIDSAVKADISSKNLYQL